MQDKRFLLLLIIAFCLFVAGCNGSENVDNTDGDTDQTEGVIDYIVMKGGSEDGGNAKEVYITFNFETATDSFINWLEMGFKIENVNLAEFSDCNNSSVVLSSDAGPLSVSVMDAINSHLLLLVPVNRDFCSLNFALPTNDISFHAKGVTSDNTSIVIETDLDGIIPIEPSTGFFSFEKDKTYNWVASFDIDNFLTYGMFQKLQFFSDGEIVINSSSNAQVYNAVISNIKTSLVIVEDQNGNGKRDNNADLHEPIVGRGEEEPPLPDGDSDYENDVEITDGDNDLDTETDGSELQENTETGLESDANESNSENSEEDENHVFVDEDDDGVDDSIDNCPGLKNTDQLDTDEDTVGDLCDNCIYTYNPYQEDDDDNDVGDLCDFNPESELCRMIECFSIFDYCEPLLGMECVGSYGLTRGFCSSSCVNQDDCMSPYSCIDGSCSCDDWTAPPTCETVECSNPLDCLQNNEVCNLLDGYCTRSCDNDEYCQNIYGEKWKCEFVIALASNACVCN